MRVLEIENVIWAKSAESADRIKNTVSGDYGWLIPKLAKYILDLEQEYGQEEIVSLYWQWYGYLVESAQEQGFYNNFTERACKQYALILTSASLIESVMDIQLNTDDIIQFIEKHSLVREANHADIGARALIYLMQYVTKYYNQFVGEGRFPDKKVVLKRWKEQGILHCEKDRYLSDIVIVGEIKVKGYKIDLPEISDDNK